VLVDLSKNRSRRFCDSGCGNRTNVAAYRARRAGQVTT
jgi:predicted RNA-binding Zn ribbon-like protein